MKIHNEMQSVYMDTQVRGGVQAPKMDEPTNSLSSESLEDTVSISPEALAAAAQSESQTTTGTTTLPIIPEPPTDEGGA